jgi:hypothetical protein
MSDDKNQTLQRMTLVPRPAGTAVVALAHCLESQQQLRANSDLRVAAAQDESDRELVEI